MSYLFQTTKVSFFTKFLAKRYVEMIVVFGTKPIPDSPYCPVTNLRFSLALAKQTSIDLKDGYLFRTADHYGYILDKPFIGSAAANRLNKHLTDLGIHNGETMYSFRSGCSIITRRFI